jgi:transposase, IS30 family
MTHLTEAQRYTIEVLRAKNYSQKHIADVIGKSPSVVCRELKRNSDKRNGHYKSDLAQRKCNKRHKDKKKNIRFDSEIKDSVDSLIKMHYSPEQVVGFLKKNDFKTVSHETIYNYIWLNKKNDGQLFKYLRNKGKRYRKRGAQKDKRGIIPDKKCISTRPTVVDEKSRFGDLEIDTIVGKNHKGAIVTINDRATGILRMKKVESRDAPAVKAATIQLLYDWKPFIQTITADNGKEFALHKAIEKELDIQFFFAHPYHPWERGANENLNGLIRQFIPKKSDLALFSDDDILSIQDNLNNRPRKRFNFESPNQVFYRIAFIS